MPHVVLALKDCFSNIQSKVVGSCLLQNVSSVLSFDLKSLSPILWFPVSVIGPTCIFRHLYNFVLSSGPVRDELCCQSLSAR